MSRRVGYGGPPGPAANSTVGHIECEGSVTDGHPVREDGEALGALVQTHAGRLRRLCRLLLADPQEAADVVQEVFVKAIEQARIGAPPRDWARWLTRVAVNVCRDRRRAGWWRWFRRRTDPIDEAGLGAETPTPEAGQAGNPWRWPAPKASTRRRAASPGSDSTKLPASAETRP